MKFVDLPCDLKREFEDIDFLCWEWPQMSPKGTLKLRRLNTFYPKLTINGAM